MGFQPVFAQTLPPPSLAAARDFARSTMVQSSLPSVAIAVISNGKIIWEEGFGWADREKRIPANEHTMYSLASISKPITATGLMILAERGLIDLDKPANDYLGRAKLQARIGDANAATIRAVASHSAGLPRHHQFFYEDEPWAVPSRDETIARYGVIAISPGERFVYSNLGYGVLDYIIERQSKMSYEEFMRREVFQPLGLTRMSVNIGPGLAPFAAQRYASDGTPLPFYTTDHPGASEVYASAHDLARFALFHLKANLPDQKKILSDKAIGEMHRRVIGDGVKEGYGIGFRSIQKDGRWLVAHSGGMGGVSTQMLLFPNEKIGIIVLTNSGDRVIQDVADRIAKTFFPNWTPTRAAQAEPAAFTPSPDLVGTWRGTLHTHRSTIPVEMEVRPNAEVVATLLNQIPSIVRSPSFQDGWLRGDFRARIDTPEVERFPYTFQLALRSQNGGLSGVVTTGGGGDGTKTRNALSHWVELKKVR